MKEINRVGVAWFLVIFILIASLSVVAAQTPKSPPKNFPSKTLFGYLPKDFWKDFGKETIRHNPKLSNVDKAKLIVQTIDDFSQHYEFAANTGLGGRGAYLTDLSLPGAETCNDWTIRLGDAFTGAGIPTSKIFSVYSEVSTGVQSVVKGVNRNHGASAVLADDGEMYVFDVWQQGHDQSGQNIIGYGPISGVGKSRYNGMPFKNWEALQANANRPNIKVNEAYKWEKALITEMVGKVKLYLKAAFKKGGCTKNVSDNQINGEIEKRVSSSISSRRAFDPYWIVNGLILDGLLNCQALKINTSVILLIDTSGSMSSNNKLTDAKRAAKKAIRSMPPDVEIGIMSYSGKCGQNFPFTIFVQDKGKLNKAIDSLSAGGGTPMTTAILQAAKAIWKFGHGEKGKIIVLCDGQNDCKGNPVQAAYVIRHEFDIKMKKKKTSIGEIRFWAHLNPEHWNEALGPQLAWAAEPTYEGFMRMNLKKLQAIPERPKVSIRIYTVGFQVSKSQQKVLDDIAKAGGGTSASAENMEELTKAFSDTITDQRKPEPKPKTKPVSEDGWQSIRKDKSSSKGLTEEPLERRKKPKGHKTGYGF